MICEKCLKFKNHNDFLMNNKVCYQCVYKNKLEIEKENKKKNLCRICKRKIYVDETLKKRQRNVFCSPECALRGHKLSSQSYWTRLLRSTSIPIS